MPRVRMLTTVPSHGGPPYEIGKDYDLSGTVASSLVRAGVAAFVFPTTERMVIDPQEKRGHVHA